MTERELFEQRFPVPAGIYWNDISKQYDALPGAAGFDDVEIYHGRWEAWQAARAQIAEARAIVDRVVAELEAGFVRCERCGDQEDTATLDCMSDLKRLQALLQENSK